MSNALSPLDIQTTYVSAQAALDPAMMASIDEVSSRYRASLSQYCQTCLNLAEDFARRKLEDQHFHVTEVHFNPKNRHKTVTLQRLYRVVAMKPPHAFTFVPNPAPVVSGLRISLLLVINNYFPPPAHIVESTDEEDIEEYKRHDALIADQIATNLIYWATSVLKPMKQNYAFRLTQGIKGDLLPRPYLLRSD